MVFSSACVFVTLLFHNILRFFIPSAHCRQPNNRLQELYKLSSKEYMPLFCTYLVSSSLK